MHAPSQWETTLQCLSLAGRIHKMIPELLHVLMISNYWQVSFIAWLIIHDIAKIKHTQHWTDKRHPMPHHSMRNKHEMNLIGDDPWDVFCMGEINFTISELLRIVWFYSEITFLYQLLRIVILHSLYVFLLNYIILIWWCPYFRTQRVTVLASWVKVIAAAVPFQSHLRPVSQSSCGVPVPDVHTWIPFSAPINGPGSVAQRATTEWPAELQRPRQVHHWWWPGSWWRPGTGGTQDDSFYTAGGSYSSGVSMKRNHSA